MSIVGGTGFSESQIYATHSAALAVSKQDRTIQKVSERVRKHVALVWNPTRAVKEAAITSQNHPELAQDMSVAASSLHLAGSILGGISQVFGNRAAKTLNDESGKKLTEIGKVRYVFRGLQSAFALSSSITAMTGINQLGARSLQATGSFCSLIGLGLLFKMADTRIQYIREIRAELESGKEFKDLSPGQQQHYARFAGGKSIDQLSNSRSSKPLTEKMEKTLRMHEMLWRSVQVLAAFAAATAILGNIFTGGVSELVISSVNLAISVGWAIIDSAVFLRDYLDGKYTKDQLAAHVVAQLSILGTALFATAINPISSFTIQMAFLGSAVLALGYNVVQELRSRSREGALEQVALEVSDVDPAL